MKRFLKVRLLPICLLLILLFLFVLRGISFDCLQQLHKGSFQ